MLASFAKRCPNKAILMSVVRPRSESFGQSTHTYSDPSAVSPLSINQGWLDPYIKSKHTDIRHQDWGYLASYV